MDFRIFQVSFILVCLFLHSIAQGRGLLSLPLQLGPINSGTISLPSQVDRFTFSGALGQRIYLDSFDLDGENIVINLTSPSGKVIWTVNHSADAGPTYLTEAGSYTVSVDGTGDTVGDYSFRIIDLGSATPIEYESAVVVLLSPKSGTMAYRFNGTNGQRINLESIVVSETSANWRLISPAGETLLVAGSISTDLGEAVLSATGPYLVLVEGTVENIAALEFRFRVSLLSNPVGVAVGFDTVHGATLLAGETNSFPYSGPSGLPIFFDALTNNSAVVVELIGPSNEVVFSSNGAADAGPFFLPRSGNYILKVGAAADAEYLFRLLDLNASSTPITNAAIYSRTFDTPSPFRTDIYRFTGSPGQRLYYDALDSDFDQIYAGIFRPGSQTLLNFQNADTDSAIFTLEAPGTYYVKMESLTGDPADNTLFRFLDVAQAPSTTVNFDTLMNGTGTPTNGVSLFRFSGTAGQRLFFDAESTNASGNWTLYSPSDAYIAAAGLSGDFEVTLPSNGTYVIAAGNSANADPFGFRILTPIGTTNALEFGAVVNAILSEPGETDFFTFSGIAGQRLYYDALETDFQNLTVLLRDPAGGIIFLNNNSDSDSGPFTLTTSGIYTLELHAPTELTGSYSFRLIDAAQAPAATVEFDINISATHTPGTSASIYRFNGSAGQRLFFDGAETNDSGNFALYSPANLHLGSAGLSQNFEVTLPVTGQYLLVAGNRGLTNETPFKFRIVTPNNTTNNLTLGATVDATLAESGESDVYTFKGVAGQRLYFDAMQDVASSFTAQMFDPSGTPVFVSGSAGFDQGLFTLAETGNYTLEIHSPSDQVGTYSFRLLDLSAAPIANTGSSISGQLNPASQAALFRINGQSGQRIIITNVLASSANATFSVVTPNNTIIISGSTLGDLGEIFLPVTGTYGLILTVASGNIGTFDFQFRVVQVNETTGTPSGFGIEENGTTTLDQTNTFTFSGTAGLPIYFDSLGNSSTATIRVIDPNNETVFQIHGSSDSGIHFLPRNGTYTVEAVGLGDGSYHFRILDLTAAATSVVFGTPYTQVSLPALRTDFYRVTATNGQRIYYDGEKVFQGQSYATLYAPGGAALAAYYSEVDMGPFTLTQPGIYYLAIASLTLDDSANYSFRLLDIAQAPVSALTFDSEVTGAVDPGTRANVYHFNGIAGRRFFFDGATTNGAGSWSLIAPDNAIIAGNPLSGDFEITLPQNGQYVLVAGNSGGIDPFSYSFRVTSTVTATNTFSIGISANGSLSNVGEEDFSTFNGTAGQRLYYDALDGDADNLRVQLFDPLGTVVFDHNAEQDSDPFTLLYSGTYSLRFKHYADGTGNYSFRLLDTADASTVLYDTVINDFVTNTFGARLYFIPATANLPLIVDGLDPVDGLGIQRLYSKNDILQSHLAFGQDFEITPQNADPYLLVFRSSVSTNLPYNFQVIPGNHPPVLAPIGARIVNESNILAFTVTATDLEAPNDQLTFSLAPGAPSSATIHPVTGAFFWTPVETHGPGVYPVTIKVTDDGIPPLTDFETFNITVNEVNVAPVLTVPGGQNVNELSQLNVSVTATDPDIPVNGRFFSLISPPTGMTINADTGVILWTPSENQGPLTYTITVVVTDLNTNAVNTQQLSTTNTFTVTVNEVNAAPLLTAPAEKTIHAGTTLSVNATAFDPDLPANTFSFSLVSGPPSLSVSSAGLINWSTTPKDVNTTNRVILRVTDTGTPNLSSTNSFFVKVVAPPTITSIDHLGNSANLTWTSLIGSTYRLQFQTNLIEALWINLPGDVTATGSTATKSDNTIGTSVQRFYRVNVVP